LQGQRRKLLDAHYAGAIPITLLKTEQDRLTEEIEGVRAATGQGRHHQRGNRAELG
jgi:hypothetical protein